MAYHGPSGHLVGNVRINIWAYEQFEDVGRLFTIQNLLFMVDCISVGINTALLSKFGNVNLIQGFGKVINFCFDHLCNSTSTEYHHLFLF